MPPAKSALHCFVMGVPIRRCVSWSSLASLVLAGAHCGGGDEGRACTDIVQAAEGAIQDAQRRADRSCTQDSDCFIFDFGVSCIQQCTSGLGAAAMAAQSTLEAENAALQKQYCTQLARPDCKRYLDANIPSCTPLDNAAEAFCLNGKCESCAGDKCLLEDEMQVCTLSQGELGDCYSVR
jgi:hypothetical protein